jgi:hypothetical protein
MLSFIPKYFKHGCWLNNKQKLTYASQKTQNCVSITNVSCLTMYPDIIGHWYSFINIQVKVKVKWILVLALRLCTGRTAHRGSRGIALLFHDQRH